MGNYKIKEKLNKNELYKIKSQNGIGVIEGTKISFLLSQEDRRYAEHLGFILGSVREYNVDKGITELDTTCCVQTHVHSEFSLLDGLSKLGDLAKKAEISMALTDHGNTFGILQWQKEMKKLGKKPIFGIELYIKSLNNNKKRYHLVVLAKNKVGLKNLYKLSSIGYNPGNFHIKPQIGFDDLEAHYEGLICTSGCIAGEVAAEIRNGNIEEAKKVAKKYHSLFKDDYYLEIQRHNIEGEEKTNLQIVDIAHEEKIKLIATNDSHYVEKEDALAHDILLCINQKKTIDEKTRWSFDGDGYHLMTGKEMFELYYDIPEALVSTMEIAMKCDVSIETGVYHLPEHKIPKEYSSNWDYLESLIDEGFKERFSSTEKYANREYLERLEYEKGIISKMGYTDYFLNVWDYIRFARENGIMVGPGRGSAAGSLVAYSLKITDLDPIEYGLLFERFLNPERVSMPDIDVDFEYSRRQEVIDYCKRRYGEDKVCNIITFGTMAAKMAIKDVARTMNKQSLGEKLAKCIPEEPGMTIKKAMEQNQDFLELLTNNENKEIVNMAMKLEGNKRQTSVHACGIVIAPERVSEYLPTSTTYGKDDFGKKTDERILVSQVTKDEVEEMGLLKCDFLGLRTMGVIGSALKMINTERRKKGIKEFNDYREIPLNDCKVYEYIARGNSPAIFQIESAGMKSFMTQLYSDVSKKLRAIKKSARCEEERMGLENKLGGEMFERMIAGISLYRPGPLDFIPDYLEGMKNPDLIKYDHPLLEPILKSTYGVIVYQETVMQIVRELAGFSMGQADTIRKAMGKKKQEILDEYKAYFIEGSGSAIDTHTGELLNIKGCIANGISGEVAEKIWEKMKDFAKYAFNKSHAAVYSVLTVVCAWMKYYYPAIYMTAMLNAFIESSVKVKLYLSVAKSMKLTILPPDVNESEYLFTVKSENSIRFGLYALSNIGHDVVSSIVETRNDKGVFLDIQDFAEKMISNCKVTKKILESLIYSGALDNSEGSRAAKLHVVEHILHYSGNLKKDYDCGQLNFFDISTEFKEKVRVEIPQIPELPKREKLELEKKYAGFYVTEHPLDDFENEMKGVSAISIAEMVDEVETPILYNGSEVTICGIATKVITKNTKDSKLMKIFSIEDRTSSINCVMFPKSHEKYGYLIREGELLCLKGIFNCDDGRCQIIVDGTCVLEALRIPDKVSKIFLRAENEKKYIEYVSKLKLLPSGTVPVKIQFDKKLHNTNILLNASSSSFMELLEMCGKENVIFQ